MKKIIYTLLALFLVSAALTGCGHAEFKETMTPEELAAKYGSILFCELGTDSYPYENASEIITVKVIDVYEDEYVEPHEGPTLLNGVYQVLEVTESFKGDLKKGDRITIIRTRDERYRLPLSFFGAGGYLYEGEEVLLFLNPTNTMHGYTENTRNRCYIEDGKLVSKNGMFISKDEVETVDELRAYIPGRIEFEKQELARKKAISEEKKETTPVQPTLPEEISG